MPVRGCARGVILLKILLQPREFGGKPRAIVRTAARLGIALDVERDQVPVAQIIGIPAIAVGTEVPRLSVLSRYGLGEECLGARGLATGRCYRARVLDRSCRNRTIGI